MTGAFHYNAVRAAHSQKIIATIRYHEAAHAVAAMALGFAVHDIEVDAYHRNGFVDTNMRRTTPIADQLIILHAGIAAEDRFWPQRPGRSEYGKRGDMTRARDLVAGNAAGSQMLEEARRRAAQIVERHWAAVEALANRLADCGGTLSGAEAAAIAKSVSGLGTNTPELTTRARTAQLSANVGSAGNRRQDGRRLRETDTLNVLADGKPVGEIVKRGYRTFDAFRIVGGDLQRVGRYPDVASAARAI